MRGEDLWREHLGREGMEGPTISKAWATIRTAISFLPLFRPFIIRALVRRSMMGHWALRKRLTAYRPAEWGM